MQALPGEATAPVLVLVGSMMMSEAANLDWHDMKVRIKGSSRSFDFLHGAQAVSM